MQHLCQRYSNVAQFQMSVCFCSCAEISPLAMLSAEVSPMWLYVMIFSRLMATICADARLQSMMVCHTNRKTKLEIKAKRILDLAP